MQFGKNDQKKKKPVVLVIMDGLGVAPQDPGNAVYLANTQTLDYYWPRFPHGFLHSSGTEVGLPMGVPGNSEVCHLNIGAGKIVIHDLPRIDQAISNGKFFTNEKFLSLIEHVKKYNSNLHIAGLVGSGFAHSSMNHLKSLIDLYWNNLKDTDCKIFIHCFTDGRDSPPKSSANELRIIESWIENKKNFVIASIIGRYYSMDRDERWERTQKAYELLLEGKGEKYDSFNHALESMYQSGLSDEFLTPSILPGFQPLNDKDGLLIFNFRSDRALQLTSSIVLSNFDKFLRNKLLNKLEVVTMSRYGEDLPVEIAFDPDRNDLSLPLAKIISDNALRQLHISESEKFPHVTYFFNGENRHPFPNETWIEIPSPRDVPTYDKKPEMSTYEVTDKLIDELRNNDYDFVLVNYANTDMVGHTGVLEAAIKAVESVDISLKKLIDCVLEKDGTVIITADHGNIEEMINKQTGEVDTQHSIYPVPILFVYNKLKDESEYGRELRFGRLADIAPTILSMLSIEIPKSMSGRNLFE